MHAVHRRTDCRVRSKIPGMSTMVPAVMVILVTRSSSVSTTDLYTRSPDLTCLDFFLWGHMNQLVYETTVETEADLAARITVAAGKIADMSGIFERTGQSMVGRCTACIQINGRVFEQTPAVITMLNFLLCKSVLASEIAVRDHMYHNEIYLF